MNSQSRDPPNLGRLDQRLRSVGLMTLLVGIAEVAILNITRKGAPLCLVVIKRYPAFRS
jgi:hypothetical protein